LGHDPGTVPRTWPEKKVEKEIGAGLTEEEARLLISFAEAMK
jgi:hypothetical protein